MSYFCDMEESREIELGYRDLCLGIRRDLGYTQRELSDRLGVSVSTIKRFERDGVIRLGTFLRLLSVLGIQVYIDYGR